MICRTRKNRIAVWTISLFAVLCSYSVTSHAVFTIEVKRGTEAKIPISIAPFSIEHILQDGLQLSDIIETDLNGSGRFDVIPRTDHLSQPHELKSVDFKDWRLINSEALVIGRVINIGNGLFEVRFRLLDVYREKQLVGQKFRVPAGKIRKVAHQISDIIYQKLTGTPGAFDTRIAYVVVQEGASGIEHLLQVSDADGWNPTTILNSTEPILSPTWSPDGNQIAYVSFESGRSTVFVQDVWTGQRRLITEFRGLNSAPAWSPDARKLALTLSKDGNPEIYIFDMETSGLQRVTNHDAIDTEPAWSPDSKFLLFTSGRSGGAQIYRISVSGGPAQRLTFQGEYNANASYSPDGRLLSLITNQGNGYKVGIYSFQDQSVRELTSTSHDESPSFAPNGDVIVYATQRANRTGLATVSVDGQVQQVLKLQGGSIREPAWSPFTRKL